MGWGGGNEVVSRIDATIRRVFHMRAERGLETTAEKMADEILDDLVNVCRELDADNLYELEGQSDRLDRALYVNNVIEKPSKRSR